MNKVRYRDLDISQRIQVYILADNPANLFTRGCECSTLGHDEFEISNKVREKTLTRVGVQHLPPPVLYLHYLIALIYTLQRYCSNGESFFRIILSLLLIFKSEKLRRQEKIAKSFLHFYCFSWLD